MPYRNPNQLLGTEGGSIDDRGGHPYVFVETTTANPTTASIKFEGSNKDDKESLAAAKRKIRRLKEAVKSLEACVKSRRPDTTAAWQAEAERLQAELNASKQEQRTLMQDLTAARDGLAQSLSRGGNEVQAAVEAEAGRWKFRVDRAGQECEELRKELQQSLTRCEELEQAKTSVMFELSAERSKIVPKGVDPLEHEDALRELEATRLRLQLKEEEAVQAGELALAEFERTRAESLQDMSHLRSTIEEARAELAREKAAAAAQLAREQAGAAAAEASLSKLTAEHRTLITEAATLRAEVVALAGMQRRWEAWSRSAGEAVSQGARDALSAARELAELKTKVKGAEERMDACANESQRRVSQLASALPKPAAGAWSDQAAAATADA